MKAIETLYNKVLYRSRLEARWAVYFDALNIKHEYEPEGYTYGGMRYLPDFYLSNLYYRSSVSEKVYVEIKPSSYDKEEIKSSNWFDKPLFLFKGIPIATPMFECWSICWDQDMKIYKCDKCGSTKIDYGFDKSYCNFCDGGCDYDIISKAEETALSYRFLEWYTF